MKSIQNLTPEIQKRISDSVKFLEKDGMRRPSVKFIGSILTAMLKSHHVQVTKLARCLKEPIAPKKTWERMNSPRSRAPRYRANCASLRWL